MRNRFAYPNEFLENQNGSMTVEFVTIAPLLIAALVFSFEFGRAFWAFDVLARDVRAAVRYMARDTAAIPPYADNTCPDAARYIAQTGSPKAADFTQANKHFPWKGVPEADLGFSCPVARLITVPEYNDSGSVVRMEVSVPLTLSLIQFINRVSGASIPSYPLTVSYEARYIGN